MQKLFIALFLLSGIVMQSQIKGKVTSGNGQGIPFVSITIQNTYIGTTANEDGQYELPIKAPGNYTILFQSIGFKTKSVTTKADKFPHQLDIVLA